MSCCTHSRFVRLPILSNKNTLWHGWICATYLRIGFAISLHGATSPGRTISVPLAAPLPRYASQCSADMLAVVLDGPLHPFTGEAGRPCDSLWSCDSQLSPNCNPSRKRQAVQCNTGTQNLIFLLTTFRARDRRATVVLFCSQSFGIINLCTFCRDRARRSRPSTLYLNTLHR